MNYNRDQGAMVMYRNEPIIIGGYGTIASKTAEFLNNNIWTNTTNIPLSGRYFFNHAALVIKDWVRNFILFKFRCE